jgi:hypothetical protein
MLDNIPTLRAGRRQSDELPELSGRNFKIEPAIRHAKLDVRKEKPQSITLLPIRKHHKTPQMFSIPARCRSTSNCSKKNGGPSTRLRIIHTQTLHRPARLPSSGLEGRPKPRLLALFRDLPYTQAKK